ncbi:transmembrane protein 45B-like [Watersipora subatra]|uniref:transmembrane protein 45B-like n=1 Tax=Watersipora subatra TaxID=2589382 RepID=UPI00355B5274
MGTWLGHAAPGSFFIAFSLWWTLRILSNYFKQPRKYVNSTNQFCCCKKSCWGRQPLDNWILMFIAALGVFMEIATSMVDEGVVVMGNRQHLTMYISFGLFGMISILVHHKVAFVPKGAEYMALLVALIVELVLFAFHLHGREVVDVHIHMLLVYTIGGCIVTTAIEFLYPQSINAGLARQYMILVQGTWFYQIAFTLYPPEGMSKWQVDDPENIMLVTLIYSWHLIGCLMVFLVLSGLTYLCCSFKQGDTKSREYTTKLLSTDGDNQTKADSPALMNGYASVGSEDETELFSVPQKSSHA